MPSLIKPVSRIMQVMQQHRGSELGLFGGNDSMRTTHDAKESEITAAFAELERQLPVDLSSVDDWNNIKADWDNLRGALIGTTEESFAAHTDLIDRLQMFMGNIADLRGLTIDADIGLYYSIDTAINALPRALEKNGANTFLRHQCTGIETDFQYQQHRMLELITELGTRSSFSLLALTRPVTTILKCRLDYRRCLGYCRVGTPDYQPASHGCSVQIFYHLFRKFLPVSHGSHRQRLRAPLSEPAANDRGIDQCAHPAQK